MKIKYLIRRLRAYAGRGFLVRQQVVIDKGQDVDACVPIFIIGTHRSGTSLLRRILDSHSAIACPPESLFIEGYLKLHDNYLEGFKGVGFQGDMLRKVIRNQASYFHESYMTAKGKKRWADKTPQYWKCIEGIKKLYGGRVKFVFIVRDPRDVAYSIFSRGWSLEEASGAGLQDICSYVTTALQAQSSFLKNNSSISHVLDYGFLNDNPEQVLKALFAFLGEDWESSVLEHHKYKHDFGVEDPMVRGIKGFKRSEGSWRSLSESDQMLISQGLTQALQDWDSMKGFAYGDE